MMKYARTSTLQLVDFDGSSCIMFQMAKNGLKSELCEFLIFDLPFGLGIFDDF